MSVVTSEKWNDFIARSSQASFLQSWQWGEMQRTLSVPFWRLVVGSSEQPQAVALVLRRDLPMGRSWLYIPRGPVCASSVPSAEAWQDLHAQLVTLAQEQRSLFVRVEPSWPPSTDVFLTQGGWRKAEREVQPRHTLVVDITQSEDALLASLHHKTRYNIRLAEKKGVVTRFSTAPADLEHFIALSQHVQGRSVFRYHPASYYQAMLKTLSEAGQLEVAIAEHEGQVLAAHILISFAGTTTYVHGASASLKRELMAPHLLQWQSIQRAKARGDRAYDFFGVAPVEGGADHPWAGITRFKEGFGGQRVSYVGAYDYVVEAALYSGFNLARRLKRLWR